MDPSRYNLNYSMSMGLLSDQAADMYGNPAAMAALGSSRPPSGGLLQNMSGSPSLGFGGARSAGGGGGGGGLIQCQSSNSNLNNASQQRGIKRAGSDCYEDHHRGGSSGGMSSQSLQGLDSQQQQQQQSGGSGTGNLPDVGEDSYSPIQSKKSPPANGKKTKGRVKIKMEYIDNKLRRYTTFSKRKTGIMKKAYELSTLTGTQVMLLVASETGHVYTFATRKLQPMITSEAGKQLIQTCLNSPDPPTAGGGDQRMSATGFEETELSYNIADEDSKDDERSISANDSDDSSDFETPCTEVPPTASSNVVNEKINTKTFKQETHNTLNNVAPKSQPPSQQQQHTPQTTITNDNKDQSISAAATGAASTSTSSSSISNIPHEMLLQLIQSGHLQLHTEEDGSGHQYVAIPIATSTANLLKATKKSNAKEVNKANQNDAFEKSSRQIITTSSQNGEATIATVKQELE